MSFLKNIRYSIERKIFKEYGKCRKCNRPFPMLSGSIQITYYVDKPTYNCTGLLVGFDSEIGYGYLCKECWDKITVKERIKIYSDSFIQRFGNSEFQHCKEHMMRSIISKSGDSYKTYERKQKLNKIKENETD